MQFLIEQSFCRNFLSSQYNKLLKIDTATHGMAKMRMVHATKSKDTRLDGP